MVRISSEGKHQIQSILSGAVESKRTSGLVFGATNIENELFFAQAGPRIFNDPSSGPMTKDTIFRICSQAKMLASIAIFQLIEAGKLTLDTDAAEILPELANPVVVSNPKPGQLNYQPPESKITIRHLLNHSSGLDCGPEKGYVRGIQISSVYLARQEKMNPIGHFFDQRKGLYPTQPLKFEPGTSFAYSFGCDALGFIVERLTSLSLEQYYKANIFLPLGINNTSFCLDSDLKKKVASMSYRELDGTIVPWDEQILLVEDDPEKLHVPMSGALYHCSMKDYLTLLQHLLQIKAGIAVNPILTSASVETFFQPTLPPLGTEVLNKYLKTTGQQWSFGQCLSTVDLPGRRRKGSAWWWGWAGTYNVIDPETSVALVLGSQLVPSPDPEVAKIWREVEEVFYRNLVAVTPVGKGTEAAGMTSCKL